MRKLKMLAAVIMTVLMIAGCASEPKEKVTEPVETETVKQIDWFTVIPDLEEMFPNGDIATIMTEPTGIYRVTKHVDGDWEKFVEAAKEKGFTNIKHKSKDNGNKIFFAYDKDHKYYLEASVNGANDIFDITIKESEQEE